MKKIIPSLLYTTTFIEIDSGDVNTMLGYVYDLLNDLEPLLLPIVAIGVGLIVFVVIIRAIRG